MKKQIIGKIVALGFVLAATGIALFLYKEGRISLLPDKTSSSFENREEMASFPFTEKEYSLSYADRAVQGSYDIADFEESENWVGDAKLDYTYYVTGKSGLSFISQDYEKSSASFGLANSFNFDDFSSYKMFVYLFSSPSNIEEFKVIFSNRKEDCVYSIRDLSEGWNLVTMPKDKFFYEPLGEDIISKIRIELVSRTKTMASATVDTLWAEKESNYFENWNISDENSLALKNFSGKDNLLLAGRQENLVASIKEITSVKDCNFSAKFTPLAKGEFGLFIRGNYRNKHGYYLTLSGVDKNNWQIRKIGIFDKEKGVESISLGRGSIDNFRVELEKSYWLRAELSGRTISFSASLDGANFSKLGDVNDGSFSRGGVGIVVSSFPAILLDDLQFSQ